LYPIYNQQAILPPLQDIKRLLANSFIIYQPKDIVAGDFYWLYTKKEMVYLAAADCTGHGVPGAMVSIVCSNALNQAVKDIKEISTGAILDTVTDLVIATFEKSGEYIQDGYGL